MADHDGHDHHPHDNETPQGRTTAPQSEYTTRDIAVGAAVAAVGFVVTFVVPIALTL